MGREFELKYAATPAVLAALEKQYPGGRKIAMQTAYYDTPAGDLSARRMTLRLRKENGTSICTFKCPLPDGSRAEWECHAEDIHDGIRAMRSIGAPERLENLTRQGVIHICGARFTRIAIEVPTIDGVAELALDSGVLLGGGREERLCEVEVELKSGSEVGTTALASLLAATYGLTEEPTSKFKRAYALSKGENDG